MADERWWTSARCTTGGGGDATSRRRISSISFELPAAGFVPHHVDGGAASSAGAASFLDDTGTHLDWMSMQSEPADAGFDALVRLHAGGDASHRFLLTDQGGGGGGPPVVLPDAPYADGDVASQHSQYGSTFSGSYGGVPTLATTKPFSHLQLKSSPSGKRPSALQQFPRFFTSPGLFGTAPISPPHHLLQAVEPKPLKSNTAEPAARAQDACSSPVTRRSGTTPDSPAAAVKKPRIQTPSPSPPSPSPSPTFKVRKEKLGDRITALQQLVSPFGKTDTASVLHEAIGYIRFLHDQVASLSSPYLMSCGRPVHQKLHYQQGLDGVDEGEEEDLRSRGLCLVPVASTYTVASETAPEFWHPTFGCTFR